MLLETLKISFKLFLIFILIILDPYGCEQQTHFRSSLLSLRKIASANPSSKTIFRNVKPFVLMLAYQIKG